MFNRLILLIYLFLFPTTYMQANELLTIGNNQFQVKLAITQEEQTHGLKHVTKLENNHGMLFVYPNQRLFEFWMKDTLISLDILFFDSNGRLLEIIMNVPPCKNTSCIKYRNQQPAQFVLELAAGVSNKLGLKPGDEFKIKPAKDLH